MAGSGNSRQFGESKLREGVYEVRAGLTWGFTAINNKRSMCGGSLK